MLVALLVIAAVVIAVLWIWTIVLAVKDEGWLRGLLYVWFVPISIVIFSCIDTVRAEGVKRFLFGYNKADFEAKFLK